ncbi:hypothetical protein FOCG_03704 [Fusarium oxysporum f. sp. radicis-lycopersici 26381]|uniref:Uncharacterized protein n=4 Tax=Fusarium oxysporum TaxID=5507 RepID=W9I511_FUSOX|nr:hypothetical protein FOXG_18912 [Fusarium oxysporum f. sp. lycopersici 4287]EWY89933.1 hypothetical protein FOYG_07577 [Fusarium oxysporum NRRL 32931]EWZ36529.1 hypothetical protein FOZG_10523 [Fusarium oxysporum Fo47]EWZ90807.1 hypothetical protein FOWG_08380 [Fusarium oxysporum f. sp. lycopersici MN25]EXK38556.1 hypothetical protein FOMG_06129 [Fusarium oxysporum f. sp. melonis 26406]EXL55990.1 hypothetical protein FOCG_03704 [Fusarium oxysporum f. sp. radicis-lycopersici 26381]
MAINKSHPLECTVYNNGNEKVRKPAQQHRRYVAGSDANHMVAVTSTALSLQVIKA